MGRDRAWDEDPLKWASQASVNLYLKRIQFLQSSNLSEPEVLHVTEDKKTFLSDIKRFCDWGRNEAFEEGISSISIQADLRRLEPDLIKMTQRTLPNKEFLLS